MSRRDRLIEWAIGIVGFGLVALTIWYWAWGPGVDAPPFEDHPADPRY